MQNLNGIQPVEANVASEEVQGTEEHVKGHHEDTLSKIHSRENTAGKMSPFLQQVNSAQKRGWGRGWGGRERTSTGTMD